MRFAGTQLTNFIDPTNFDAIGKSSINGRSIENQASMQSEAYVDRAEIKALADIEAAKFGAEATRAQGSAQGQASMFSGLGSMASGLAGGFGTLMNKTPAIKPQPTALEAFDAGTFFAQDYLNR
jgi:hypothetical protein